MSVSDDYVKINGIGDVDKYTTSIVEKYGLTRVDTKHAGVQIKNLVSDFVHVMDLATIVVDYLITEDANQPGDCLVISDFRQGLFVEYTGDCQLHNERPDYAKFIKVNDTEPASYFVYMGDAYIRNYLSDLKTVEIVVHNILQFRGNIEDIIPVDEDDLLMTTSELVEHYRRYSDSG